MTRSRGSIRSLPTLLLLPTIVACSDGSPGASDPRDQDAPLELWLPSDAPPADQAPRDLREEGPSDAPLPDPSADPATDPGSRDAPQDQADETPGDVPPRDPGPCPEGEECEPTDPCASGLFQVTSLEIMGGSFQAEARAGSSMLAVWRWVLANPSDCPDCQRPLVLGIERTPAACVMAPSVAVCPGLTEGESLGALKAPSEPGTYTVFAAAPQTQGCDEARTAFPSDASRIPVGVVRVPGDCPPETCPGFPCTASDCRSLDKACGTWGDGCRHPLECGACPEGESCTLQGRCEGPCTRGVLEVAHLRLAGSGTVASIRQGDPVALELRLQVANPSSCPSCPRFAALGWDPGSPPDCLDLGPVPTCPDTTVLSLDRVLPVPGDLGTNALVLAAPPEALDCKGALEAFTRPSQRMLLGTLQVHRDCDPVSCRSRNRECGPADDGCGVQLSCGDCPTGDLCSPSGQCGCDGSDPFEPNDTPADAHGLEPVTDSDAASRQTLRGSLFEAPDWFQVPVTDVPLAIVDPFVRVRLDRPASGTLTVAYACRNRVQGNLAVQADSDCTAVESLDLGPGLPLVPGIRCPLLPAVTTIHFEPACPGGTDDSGTLLLGLSDGNPCTAFGVDLHR